MKKVVSLIMSFIMVAMLFPFNVWAAETKHGYQGDDSVLNYENTNEEIGASVEFDVKDEENFQVAEQKPTVPDNLLSEKDYIFSESCKEIKIIEIFETKDEKVILSDEETMTAAMDGTIDSGYCGAEGDGTNLIWTIDENNTLTISGEGAMADYGRVESDGWNISLWINATPWEDYNINSLVIDEGVTSIGICSFYNFSSINGNLTIPESVTSIGSYAFKHCSGFTGDLFIPDSVSTIGIGAFENCFGFDGNLLLPNGLAVIEPFTFSNCSGLTGNLDIPDGVTTIGRSAFENCYSFTGDIEIPEGITVIDEWVFANCSGFNGKVIIPNSVKEVRGGAFWYCSGLKGGVSLSEKITFLDCSAFSGSGISALNVSNNNETFCSIDGIVCSKDRKTIITCPGGKTDLIIPETVTTIGGGAFQHCYNLTGDLFIPENVTTIKGGAFAFCSGLTGDLIIPDNVTFIGSAAFNGCEGFFGKLVLPKAITSIESYTFSECSGLTGNIIIPDGVAAISDWAFSGCGINDYYFEGNAPTIATNTFDINYDTIYYPSGNTTWEIIDGKWNGYTVIAYSDDIIASGYCGGEGDGTNLIWALDENGVLTISGEGAMADFGNDGTITTAPWGEYSDNLKTLVIGDGVTTIGQYAFYKCYGFEGDIIIPDSVTVIGKLAFANCSGFNGNLTISKNVTSMGISVFYGCSNLTGNLVIPENLTEIGYCTFYKCSGLSGNLVIPDSVTSIGQSAFRGCEGFNGSLVISDNVVDINETAFYGCTGFSGDLIIPDRVTTIGIRAFFGCEGFDGNLVLSKNISYIGEYAFSYCFGLTGNLVIPYTVTSIGEFVFYSCGINDYYFEGDAPWVEPIDAEWPSFDYDDTIYYPKGNSTWEIVNGEWNGYIAVPYDYEPEVLSGYCGGEGDGANLSWTFSSGTLTITGKGKMANYDVPMEVDLSTVVSDAPWSSFGNKITKVVFDDEVTTIGSNSFINNKNLTSINLPDSLLQICTDAFYGCENLSGELIMPDSLIKIDSLAFWGTAISSLELGENVKEIGFFAFGACLNLEAVYFNEALTKIGNWAFLYDENIKNDIVFYENLKSIGNAAFVGCNNVEAFYFRGDAPSVNAAENEQPTFNADAKLYYPSENSTWEIVDGKWNGYNAEKWYPDAIDYGYCGGEGDGTNLTWVLTEDGTLTISGEGKMKNYDYSGYKTNAPWGEYTGRLKTLVIKEGVTTIGEVAFARCAGFTGGLVIPESIMTIGDSAFSGCTGFTGDLVIPDSVTTIGDSAFRNCTGFTGNLVIGNSVTTIKNSAFYGCTSFTGGLVIGNSVTTIGDWAFLDCSGFTGNLIIPDSTITIGEDTFSNCSGFTGDLVIPDNVTTIEKYAFAGCTGFGRNLVIGDSVTTIGNGAFSGCSGFTGDLIIPDSVTTIEKYAFNNCSGFTGDLVIGNSVTTIGENAFNYCSGFTGTVAIPDSVTTIGSCAFSGTNIEAVNVSENNKEYSSIDGIVYTKDKKRVITCPGGKKGELVIPDSVIIIGSYAFYECEGFTGDLIIPEGVTYIEDYAFCNCGFSDYYFEGDAPNNVGYLAFEFDDTIYYPLGNDTWEITNGKWNGYQAFPYNYEPEILSGYCGGEGDGTNLQWTIDEKGTLTISGKGKMANYYYENVNGRNITSAPWGEYSYRIYALVICEEITNIGDYAFYRCDSIRGDLVIPDGIKVIGNCAFYMCGGFYGNLVIGDNVIGIGEYAFYKCSGLTGDLVIPNSVITIGDFAFFDCDGFGRNLVIGDSVTTIGDYAFEHCSGFTGSLVIPDSVTTIGKSAFYECSGFTGNLVIPDGVTTIGDYAFEHCFGFTGSLVIGNGVTTIGDSAFCWCYGFKGNLVIGDNVTTIGEAAFSNCYNFTGNLVIPDSVTTIENSVFSDCGNFTGNLVIPDSVTIIKDAAFSGCGYFTGDLVIGNSVTAIGNNAFYGCYSFTGNLTIPDSVTTIGDSAFSGCKGFTGNLVMPDSITAIGKEAFYDCGINEHYFTSDAPIVTSANSLDPSFDYLDIVYYPSGNSTWEVVDGKWNGYTTIPWNPYVDGSLSSGEEGFYIKDAILGIPVDNAQLYYGDKVLSSDSKGFIPFSGEISDFEITGHAYTTRTFKDFKRSSTGIDVITLTPNTEAISKAELNYNGTKYDLLSEHKTLNTKKKDTSITITCEAPSKNVAGYALYQRIDDHGIDIRAESTGTFKLKLDDFIPGYDVYIMTYDSNHKKLAETRIGLNVVNEESFAPSSVKLGKDISFTVAEDVPLLGGIEMNVNMPLLPFTFELTDEKVLIGINFDIAKNKNLEGWKRINKFTSFEDVDLANAIDKFCADVKSPSASCLTSPFFDMDIKVVGYAEGNLDGSCIEGKIYIKFNANGGHDFPFVIGSVPVVIGFSVSGEVSSGGEIKLTPTDIDYTIPAKVAITPDVYLGVGLKVASAGVYGKVKIQMDVLLLGSEVKSGVERVFYEASLGVRIKVLGKELVGTDLVKYGPKDLYNQDLENADKTDSYVHNPTLDSTPGGKDIASKSFNDEVMSLLVSDKVYPAIDLTEHHTADVLYSNGNGNASELLKYVEKDAYIGINQKIVSAGNTLMAVYTAADLSRNPEDASILVYSIYNEQTDGWSSPVAINDDGTADFSPEVYSDGEDIYVVWQDAESKIAENLTLNEIGATTALSVAKFDTDANEWVDFGTIQNSNNSYEAQPQIAVNGEIITVAWASNSENDVFGLNGTNSVRYSVYDGENWSEAITIKETNCPVTNLSAGTLDGVLTIAYSIDADGDLVGFDDTVSYAYSQNSGEIKEIGQGATDVQFSSVYGEENMVWCENSSIYSMSSINGEKVKITSNADIIDGSFIVCGTENSGAILYSSYCDGSTNIKAVIYDSSIGDWGMPVLFTDQAGYMENIDAVYHNGNLFVFGVQRFVDMTEDYAEICNLVYVEREYSGQATITHAEHKNEDEIIPGGETIIIASVANKGTAFVENALFKIENSNAEILFDEPITVNLKPGETKEVELKFRLPDEAKKDTYTVSCGNSSRDVVIGFAKINLYVSEYAIADKNYLSMKIENTGFEEIEGAVAINDYADDSINYFSDNFDKIGYCESITAIFEISPNLFSDCDTLPVCIKVNTDGEINPYSETRSNINLYKQKTESFVESIEVNVENAKLNYSIEDSELDTTGVVVTAHYSDGTEKDISSICVFSGYENTVGSKDINVAYKEGNIIIAEATYQIYVSDGKIYGDINLDGEVNVKDVYYARLIAAKLIKPTDQQIVLGDVDLDGRITAIDANIIRKFVVKIITSLPVEL